MNNKTRTESWESEKLFIDGDDYFADIVARIKSAQESIEVEAYIFRNDEFGLRIVDELCAAARRGLQVRVLVDGVGSLGWTSYAEQFGQAGVKFRIYHPVNLSKFASMLLPLGKREKFIKSLRDFNRRNHRKVWIIDRKIAWAGGINIASYHLHEYAGQEAWRDTAVRIEGDAISDLIKEFERVWLTAEKRFDIKSRFILRRSRLLFRNLVRLNASWRIRRQNYRELKARIRRANSRVWLTQSYFVPQSSMLKALRRAIRRGTDVRILVPGKSDLFFMPALSGIFEYMLARDGARIYRFDSKRVLHAKTCIIDDWVTVGSTNFNHRSILHDLEVDIVLTHDETIKQLSDQFLLDITQSEPVSSEKKNWGQWRDMIIGNIAYCFRYWM